MSEFSFTAYVKPEPQGSSRAFVIGGRARITSANTKLKPFRSEVARCALSQLAEANLPTPLFGQHVPVGMCVEYVFRKPPSVSKRRTKPVTKPDRDKLYCILGDSLTGILYHDDAQVVEGFSRKVYGEIEQVRVTVYEVTT